MCFDEGPVNKLVPITEYLVLVYPTEKVISSFYTLWPTWKRIRAAPCKVRYLQVLQTLNATCFNGSKIIWLMWSRFHLPVQTPISPQSTALTSCRINRFKLTHRTDRILKMNIPAFNLVTSLLSRWLSWPPAAICAKPATKNLAKPPRNLWLIHWKIHYCKIFSIRKLFATAGRRCFVSLCLCINTLL